MKEGNTCIIQGSPSKEDAKVLAHGPCDQGEDHQAKIKSTKGLVHIMVQGAKPTNKHKAQNHMKPKMVNSVRVNSSACEQ